MNADNMERVYKKSAIIEHWKGYYSFIYPNNLKQIQDSNGNAQ